MGNNAFVAFRCRLSRKPWLKNAHVKFYWDRKSDRIFYDFIAETAEPDACGESQPLICAGDPLVLLEPRPAAEGMAYDIFGGFDHNAVKAEWTGNAPRWILLKTYTGASLKQLPRTKKSPVIFPLADEDAYVYCDRDVCEKCLYCCKKGCVLYYYFGNGELRALPLDQVSEYFRRTP